MAPSRGPSPTSTNTDAQDATNGQAKARKEALFKNSHAQYVAVLILFVILQGIGIYLFTSGFLLTRFVLDNKSQCAVPPLDLGTTGTASSIDSGCWHPKNFEKAVIILIDALRYDFTVPFQATVNDPSPHRYHDALTVLYETASKQPQNAFLLPFIADPPTTTLQRLKALTTGTLPTFIEAGSNFAGTAIDEDSIIGQLSLLGKRVVHLGDDTWSSLFPHFFDPELSRPYPSLIVNDLDTVDNGVTDHIFPLLHPSNQSQWDVIIGHFLGLDHAGHVYGPEHSTLTGKLLQMDSICRQIMGLIDDSTLLVVMGDHGMDSSGNHGGESDDEKEAALWMYTKAGIFGRSSPEHVLPPKTAKERPVNQIDLVPTLSLLLGIPIPFGNLGLPIQEAFIGPLGKDLKNNALVNRLAAAQINRYLQVYSDAKDLGDGDLSVPSVLWEDASRVWESATARGSVKNDQWERLVTVFRSYQVGTLDVFHRLWTQFEDVSIGLGIVIQAIAFLLLALYASSTLERGIELQWSLLRNGYAGLALGAVFGNLLALFIPAIEARTAALVSGATVSSVCCLSILLSRKAILRLIPTSFWSGICFLLPTLLAGGFGANSFTIWEDEILLFFLVILGTFLLGSSLRLRNPSDRKLGLSHSVILMVAVRLASLSRLCREEQMSSCKTSFMTSVTNAPWLPLIPYVLVIALPNAIRYYYRKTFSYHSSAISWIGFAFRIGLLLIAIHWTLDAAIDAKLFNFREGLLNSIRVYLAQIILAVNTAAGLATFAFSAPFIGVEHVTIPSTQPTSKPTRPQTRSTNGSAEKPKPSEHTADSLEATETQVLVRGTNNLYGSHYALLPLTILLLPLLLLSKPAAQGPLALTAISIFSLVELTSLMGLSPVKSQLGPTALALLAHFSFFKTGHQAALTAIQWPAAFIALHTLSYPLAPLYVMLNTFSGAVLCSASIPALVFWRRPLASRLRRFRPAGTDTSASTQNLLAETAVAVAYFMLVFAGIGLATTVEVAWLRRHLMLYRVFMPRWALGCAMLVLVEVVAIGIGFVAMRWTVASVASVFGW